jgi:23S rRNA pseudouridine1911/1915/1917 synthase
VTVGAGRNGGWIYRDRIGAADAGLPLTAWYACRYRHSDRACWQQRLAAGEVWLNGRQVLDDRPLAAGDALAWHRPPWREPPVPLHWSVLHDDGDLHVIAKPAGLPVLPAGGFLDHTVLRLLERDRGRDPAGVPRPVHRLGRGTSGVLVCARTPASRAWLSRRLRDSTSAPGPGCRKVYRALLQPGRLALAVGAELDLATPIGRRPHPRLGQLWCTAADDDPGALAALSRLRLLERRAAADLVEVTIASGRPHQIRIHCAAAGAPLLGDPLYGPGGLPRDAALPGDGGYRLHALRLQVQRPDGTWLVVEAPPLPSLEPGEGSGLSGSK